MHGKQQHRAIPIKHAKTTQKMAKKTSNAKKTTANLHIVFEKMKFYDKKDGNQID